MNFISTRLIWLVVLAGLFVLPFFLPNFRVFQVNLMIVYAIAVLGLNILTGYALSKYYLTTGGNCPHTTNS